MNAHVNLDREKRLYCAMTILAIAFHGLEARATLPYVVYVIVRHVIDGADRERLSHKSLLGGRQVSVPADSLERQGKTGRGGTLPFTE